MVICWQASPIWVEMAATNTVGTYKKKKRKKDGSLDSENALNTHYTILCMLGQSLISHIWLLFLSADDQEMAWCQKGGAEEAVSCDN